MPGIRDYPQANTVQASDAFVFNRIGVGTMEVNAATLVPASINPPLYFCIGTTGTPPANTGVTAGAGIFVEWNVPANVRIQDGTFTFNTGPVAQAVVMGVAVNGGLIGSVTWATNSLVGNSTISNTTTMNAGDQLQLIAPATWNSASVLALTIPLEVL